MANFELNSDSFWKNDNVTSFSGATQWSNKYGVKVGKKGFVIFRYNSNGHINTFHGVTKFSDEFEVPKKFEDAQYLYEKHIR